MIKINEIKEYSNTMGFCLESEVLSPCDWNLMAESYDRSIRFCRLLTEKDKEEERDFTCTGVVYVSKRDSLKELNEIEFENHFLPIGNTFTRKIAFLDRDGVLILDSGYPSLKGEIIFKKEVLPLLKNLKDENYQFIVVTNQSGIARGFYDEKDFADTTQFVEDFYRKNGIEILKTYFCPFHKDGSIGKYKRESIYRKPGPGMLLQAANDFNINIRDSIMIGDRATDRIKLEKLKTYVIGEMECDSDFKTFGDLNNFLFRT